MPRAKISDAYGVTVEVEASEASYKDLLAAASAEFERANGVIERRAPGPGASVWIERRQIGFGGRAAPPTESPRADTP